MANFRFRQPIRPLILFFIVKFRLSRAFSLAGGVLGCEHSGGHLSRERQSALSVGENENGDVREKSDRQKRQQKRPRRQRRRWTFNHLESLITAAGAESLFSLSLWPFLSKPLPGSARNDENRHADVFEGRDLPPVDCEWACRSDEETIQLRRMKLLLQSEMNVAESRNLHQLYPDVYSDLRLLRFLRKDKERDVVSSSERYRSFLKWREENGVDEIRATVGSDGCNDGRSSFVPANERLRRVADYFPMNFDYVTGSTADSENGGAGEKNAARPAILHVGSFDTPGISESIKSARSDVTLDDFLNYWIYLYESIHFQLYQRSLASGEMMFLDEVCDLSGLSVKQFGPYFVTKVMKPWLRMTQSNYPETTRRIYVLNPPGIINLAWNLVTPLLSEGTVDKIRFERGFDGTAEEFCEIGE